MNLPEICIRRPVMTTLLMITFVVFGAIAYQKLAVSALPRVDFPTIQITATLPGASPETMAASIASPIERQLSTIAGIASMTSSSSPGNTQIIIQFDLTRSIDGAALDVQAALSVAQRRLPPELTVPPSFRKVNPSDQPILFLALISPTLPLSTLNEYGESLLAAQISQLRGVAQVQVFGSQKFAVRVQVDPEAAAARGLSPNDIRASILAANSNSPTGTMQGPRQNITIEATKQMEKAAEYRPLVVAWKNGAPVRLDEVAKVIDSVENDKVAAAYNGERAIILAIQRQPDANTVDVVDQVKAKLPSFRAQVPPSVSIQVLNDRSLSIREAVEDVEFSLALAIALVVMVIFLFLKSIPATIIPTLALPVSIVGTFAVMYILDFSINNMTLLALTLSVGFVVDDAIVMLENIMRHIEDGMKPFQAALLGSREVGFTIISITFSLIAVFIPVLFMGGTIGRIFREFAVTITIAILISGFVSLTLTPMLCARLLTKPKHGKELNFILRGFEYGFEGVTNFYKRTLDLALKARVFILALTFATLGLTIYMYQNINKGLFPTEDTGFIFALTEAATDTSFEAMTQRQSLIAEIVRKDPAIEYVMSSTGAGGPNSTANSGRMFIGLKPMKERPISKTTGKPDHVTEVVGRIRRATSVVPGIRVFPNPTQNISIGARASKAAYQYTLTSSDTTVLYEEAKKLELAVSKLENFRDVNSDLYITNPQVSVEIDREKAAVFGITNEQIRSTLYSAYGSRQISTIFTANNDYQVILESAPKFSLDPSNISSIYLKTAAGVSVPLETVATIKRTVGPLQVQHQGQQPAVTLSFNLAQGYSLDAAVKDIERVEREMAFPVTISRAFAGTAQVFQESTKTMPMLLLAAIFVIYIILGILYESYIHPLTILSGLPSAGLGAILTLIYFKMDLSIIAVIGIVMLIGIVKKNAIMMVDFAIGQRKLGASPEEAIRDACIMRFRPIMMTTLAALFGVLPIALGHGAGAELRQPLGVAVVGGLILSQVLTLYITPVIYLYLENISVWVSQKYGKAEVDMSEPVLSSATASMPSAKPQAKPQRVEAAE